PVRRDERVLGGIEGVLLPPGHAERDRVDPPLVTADELRERFGVSVGGAAGEGSVVGAAGEAHRGPATSTSEIAARFPSPVATTDVHHTSTKRPVPSTEIRSSRPATYGPVAAWRASAALSPTPTSKRNPFTGVRTRTCETVRSVPRSNSSPTPGLFSTPSK